jgi:hypothetical protein
MAVRVRFPAGALIRVHTSVAQWQSSRLLTGSASVRVRPGVCREPWPSWKGIRLSAGRPWARSPPVPFVREPRLAWSRSMTGACPERPKGAGF